MKKFFIVYGHYDDNSFNAAIKDTFIASAVKAGHKIDLVDLYKDNFNPVFAGEEPGDDVLDHRRRIENCDTIVLIAPILSIFFGLVFDEIFVLFVSLLLGTPILTIIGMIGVSLTLVLYRGGVLLTIILIPLYIPVLIFGISSVLFFIDGSSPLGHFSILIVLNIVFLFLGPFAIASSLRVSCFI